MKTVPNVEDYTETLIMDGSLKKKTRGSVTELTTSEDVKMAGKDFKVVEDSEESIDTEQSLIVHLSSSPASETVPLRVLVASNEEQEDRSACLSHGSISVIGRRRTMEDAVTVAPGLVIEDSDLYDFFAVYDGHGGAKVASACRDRLHHLVASEMAQWSGGDGARDWERLMVECFQKMDEEVNSGGVEVKSGGGSASVRTVGSTAVVVMVGTKEIVVANCGDSRAVLCCGGVTVPLSRDHKPDRPDEKERVEAAGGRVIKWNGSRVLGVLATSRSIGDYYLKPFVIPEPEVTVRARNDSDNFIIIASDGLWDVVTNEVACEVVTKYFNGQISRNFSGESNCSSAAEVAAMLAELAMARGSRDNISVIVVQLSKSG